MGLQQSTATQPSTPKASSPPQQRKPSTPQSQPKIPSPQRNLPNVQQKAEERPPQSPKPSSTPKEENSAPDATEIMDSELTSQRDNAVDDELSDLETALLSDSETSPSGSMRTAVALVTPNDVRCCFQSLKPKGPYAQKANLVGARDDYSTLLFSNYHDVYDVKHQRQRTHPRIRRWRADPWRRYGTQKVIHEMGGYVPIGGTTVKGRKRELKYVKPGTPMPPPPTEKPIMTMDEFFRRPVMIRGGPRADEDADEDDDVGNRRSVRRRSAKRNLTLEDPQ